MSGATSFSLRSALLRNMCALALWSAVLISTAQAQTLDFRVPSGELKGALDVYVKQAGVQLVYREDDVRGLMTPGVNGELSIEDALNRILIGTSLTTQRDSSGAIAIVRVVPSSRRRSATAPAQAANSAMRLAQAEPASSQDETRDSSSTEGESNKAALEEIVVTAERREESIQSLPIAISAFSGETLIERGIGGLESLQQLAPSTQVNIIPGLAVNVSIRGISNEIQHSEPPVAMSRDGVPYAVDQLLAVDFFDVERIEVLRGPQGTISGRNATAGAINIHSNRPTDEFEGGVRTTLGNYDRLGIEGHLSGPLAGDRLLGRLAVRTDRAGGWVNNPSLGQELGTIDKTQARASFLARLTDNFEALLILDGLRDRSNSLSLVYVDDGRLRPDTPTLTEALGVPAFDRTRNDVQLSEPYNMDREQYEAILRLAWELGSSAQLTSITGYVEQDHTALVDSDGTAEGFSNLDKVFNSIRQVSQELTLTADLTDRLDVIVGALYLDNDKGPEFIFGLPAFDLSFDVESEFKLTSWAGYTQGRYRLTDEVRLTAGVRYTHDSKDFTQDLSLNGERLPREDNRDSWNAMTPRFSIDYAPSDDLTLYASASRGFKSGGIQGPTSYRPEYVWNYEAGVKANGLDGRLNTTLTGFYMDYTDLQQALEVFDPDLNAFVASIVNANSATITGVELEFDTLVTDQLRFTFGGTWLDATYDELRNPDALFPELGEPFPGAPPGGPNFRDLSGNRVVRSPEWQFNVSGEYRTPLGGDLQGVLRASYAWQDRVFYTIFNNQSSASQGAYGLINLFGAIETTSGRWQLSAFVHNLTNEHYYTNKYPEIGTAPVPYTIAWIGAPRRYGVALQYRF